MDGFKFKIGDFVVVKAGILEAETFTSGGRFQIPSIGQVIGRRLDECSAGTQYSCVVSIKGEAKVLHQDELVLQSEWINGGLQKLLDIRKGDLG